MGNFLRFVHQNRTSALSLKTKLQTSEPRTEPGTSSCFISNRRLKGLHWEMFITTYVCSDCKLASVAEWIRQCTRNPEIVGSIPLEGNFFLIFLYLLRG